MNTKEPTLDDQIAWAKALIGCNSGIAPSVLASLQRLKAIDAVQVPEEPVRYGEDTNGEFGEWRNGEYVSYRDYDTLRDLLKRTEEKRSKALKVAAMYARRMMDFEDRAEAAERQLAAMLKLGEEPSEEMANEVRGILQILRGMTGATFDKVREHCKRRGDNAELWPVWAMKAEGYVTEQGAAMLIFNIMFAKLIEQSKEQTK